MATQHHQTCALPEGLRYYLLRGNAAGGSVMVPLVPVDQLPFQLQGVPRQLTHRQISDGGWKLFAETNVTPSSISIQAPSTTFPSHPSPTVKPRYLAPDHHLRQEPQVLQAEPNRPARWLNQPVAINNTPELPRSSPARATASLSDTFASIYAKDAARLGYRTPYPSGIEPDPSKKEYCTHWIKTGECDWTVIGCKFKHEMPNLEKLRELGFTRGLPKWWKEKSAIVARPPTWMQRRVAAGNEEGEGGNKEMMAPRAFPDPATFRRKDERDLMGDGMQQPRGFLRRENMFEREMVTRPVPPPAPVQAQVHRTSLISDLLIDLEDTPASPPSPQLSSSSTASAGSSETQVSDSRTSASPPSSPVIECKTPPLINRRPTLIVDCKVLAKAAPEKSTEQDLGVRRHSQISWASDTEEDTPKPSKPTQQRGVDPIQQRGIETSQQRRKRAPRGVARRTPTVGNAGLSKPQPGLTNSKYAAVPTPDDRARPTDHRSRNTDSHARNTNRRMNPQRASEVGAPELHAKIEQLRREASQKDRPKKGAVSGPSAVALGKQQPCRLRDAW
jgi:hypothetical protein